MEYMPGGSLAERLRNDQRLPAAATRRLALEICEALATVHHRGVIHRDIKPANIFFDARGTAKLGDFGVAHLADLGQTQTGGMIGTLAYMSPEQITGAAITVTADLYSFGISLFEAITGRLPFLGPDFVAQHLGEPAPAPSAFIEIDASWDHLFASLLAKSPSDRVATVNDLALLLRHADSAGTKMRVAPWSEPARVGDQDPSASASMTTATVVESRYQLETVFRTTALSTLSRAVDTTLQRSVVMERFSDTAASDADDVASATAATVIRNDAAMDRVRTIARAATPFVQRVLSLDRSVRVAIFEAPSGRAIRDVADPIAASDRIRMIKRLARGIAAIAEIGLSHGAINADNVLIDDNGIPTILVAGTATDTIAAGASDVAAVVAALAVAPGPAIANWNELASATDAEDLYQRADRMEIALLAKS
jgi:eukaryotic-like serine/threonine-protein kinase